MVVISFKSEWRDKLLSGDKIQTIRPYTEKRFKQVRDADKLQIYINQRSPYGYKLFDAKPTKVYRFRFPVVKSHEYEERYPWLQRLAERDGFRFVEEMYSWFYGQYCKTNDNELYSKEFMVIVFKRIEEV